MQQPQPQPSPAREHEERRRKKLEEEERQAAYLNGRRLLLPGSGGATGVAKLPQRGIELLWRACTPPPLPPITFFDLSLFSLFR
jgi:hypothetical protein